MRRLEWIGWLGGILGGLVLLGGTREAKADLIPVFQGVAAAPTGQTGFTWSYRVDLTQDERLETGDFFTIYDFAGFTGVTTQPANWEFVGGLNVGLTPPHPPGSGDPGVLVDDNPNIVNLTWRWRGGTSAPGPITPFATFSANSLFNLQGIDFYAGRGTRHSPGLLTDGTKTANAGLVIVPVPEPASMALLGLGGAAAVGLYRRRRA